MILFLTHDPNPLPIPCSLRWNKHLSKSEMEGDPKVGAR